MVFIAYLLGILTALNRPKQPKMGNGSTKGASNQRDMTPKVAEAAPEIPPFVEQKSSAHEKRKRWQKNIKFWAEPAGVLVLLIYTTTTIALWLSAKEANTQAKTQWNAEHRPWVGSGEIEVRQPLFVFYPNNPPQMKTQFNFTIEVPIKNVGISPAFHVATFVTGTLTEQIAAPSTMGDMMVSACKGADSSNKNIGGVLFPNNAENRFEQGTALGSTIPQVTQIHRVWITICTAYSEKTDGEHIHHTKTWFASWPIDGELHEMRNPAQPGIVYYSFPSTRWSVVKMEAD
jgi:hypothetical protein